ncbi:MAG: hypothetical protein CEE42_04070 [Promethearchaeota archaeon Loki_b31]|nr:MAG: hypothetical protein CEE42_04070 [Candidatus Lokiarchaeota archaeon Loki_b31]
MNSQGVYMRKRQQILSVLIALFLLTNGIVLPINITAPPPPIPDQFIADIFPRTNTTVRLININTMITIDATDFSNKIGINFDGNYTLFNPENTTNLILILPFSLCIDVQNSTFEASVNDTQIPFEVLSNTEENLTSTGINLDCLKFFVVHCPITLITSNLTLLENKTYVINYQFSGSIPKPLGFRNLFYMAYYLETARVWKGNLTQRVEFKLFGKLPIYCTVARYGEYDGDWQISDIQGGQSVILEWNKGKVDMVYVGISYYGSTSDDVFGIVAIVVLNGLAYIAIISGVVIWIKRKKRN